jgi:hypothetical protein
LGLQEVAGLVAARSLFPIADHLYEVHGNIRAGRDVEEALQVDAAEWARIVRHTKRAAVVWVAYSWNEPVNWERSGHRSLVAWVSAGLSAMRRLKPEEREGVRGVPLSRWPRQVRRLVRIIHICLPLLGRTGRDAAAMAEAGNRQAAGLRALANASQGDRLRFAAMYRTILLCWVLHGEYPSQLLRRARDGDLRALEDLLRIDRRLFFDPGIQRMLRQRIGHSRSAFVRVAFKAARSRPRAIKKGMLKARFAAMVQTISGESPLFEEPGLQRMFDQVAQMDAEKPRLVDDDLPAAPEALRKAVWRETQKLAEQAQRATGQK